MPPARRKRAIPNRQSRTPLRLSAEHPSSGSHKIAGTTSAIFGDMRTELSPSRVEPNDTYLTVAEVAERLKVNGDTVRRMFLDEPGVIVLYRPRKGRRVYRTLRIPVRVYERVLNRFVKVA